MSILHDVDLRSGIAREFCVRQTRAAESKLVGTDGEGCEEVVRPGRADDVVLIDTVAADADGADEHAVAIKRKSTGKNGDAVRKGGIQTGAGKGEVGLGSRKTGECVLLAVKWT